MISHQTSKRKKRAIQSKNIVGTSINLIYIGCKKKNASNFEEGLFQNYLSDFIKICNLTQANTFVECVEIFLRLLENYSSSDYFR